MAKDNSSLPFEVRYAEMPGKEAPGKKSTMKRLAVLVKPENVGDIISSLKGLEATIYDVKGVSKIRKESPQAEEVVQLSLHIIQEKL